MGSDGPENPPYICSRDIGMPSYRDSADELESRACFSILMGVVIGILIISGGYLVYFVTNN